jgi:inositol 1,4,5-triphosphate receptor type 3
LLFLVTVTCILLNIISGIVISSVTADRQAASEHLSDMRDKCYICGLESWYINRQGEGWHQHQRRSHNVFYYLYFLIYIDRKKVGDCSAVEKYVKDLLHSNNISFFPQGRCLALEHRRPPGPPL